MKKTANHINKSSVFDGLEELVSSELEIFKGLVRSLSLIIARKRGNRVYQRVQNFREKVIYIY